MRVTLNVAQAAVADRPPRYAEELARVLPTLGVHVRVRKACRQIRLGRFRLGPPGAFDGQLPVLRRGGVLHATDHRSNPRRSPAEVVSVHDLVPYEQPGLANDPEIAEHDGRCAQRAVETAKRIIVPTEQVRLALVHRFRAGREQVKVVPLGVRGEHFRPDLRPWPASPFRPGRLNVLVAMPLERRTRVDLAVRAALMVPDVHLVHVGRMRPQVDDRGLGDSMHRAAQELVAQGRFVQREAVDDNTLRGLYSQADVVLHPALADGSAATPLQALACGARVVASDIPAHREVLDGQARFVDPTPEAMARELEAAWDGTAVRESRWADRAGRIAYARQFSWERTARETAAVYAEAVARRG